ncbi:LysE family translocator [Rhodospirillum sp. A1_3_36]|uniref:LysE family translocator n=1 Tax=Rhodospirillum sp. A1_3_36 TaxID=3391666 RepID=UPI0039A57B2A
MPFFASPPLILSMGLFALAASLSPGPVNILSLSHGARHGFRPALRHVTGATIGFILLLVLCGLGVTQAVTALPFLADGLRWGGVAFLLVMAGRLWGAVPLGSKTAPPPERPPSVWAGALLQWLNPKAWMAALAGVGTFAADGDWARIELFCALYFGICYLSIGAWAYLGAKATSLMNTPSRVQLFNRLMALALAGGALGMTFD